MNDHPIKVELLKFLQIKNNEELKRQNKVLSNLVKEPGSSMILMSLLDNEEVHSLQQLISILLKKSIAKRFLDMSPEEKEELKKTLLFKHILHSTKFKDTVLQKLCESVGAIVNLDDLNVDQWPELYQILIEGMEFTDKNKTMKSLFILDSILQLETENIIYAQQKLFFSKLLSLFENPYDSGLDPLYLIGIKLLAGLSHEMMEDEGLQEGDEEFIFSNIMKSIKIIMTFPTFIERNFDDAERIMTNVYENLAHTMGHAVDNFNYSKESILEVVLSDLMMTHPRFSVGLKSAGSDILLITIKHFREELSRDKKDTRLFQRIYKIFFDLAVEEEKEHLRKIAEDPNFDEHDYIQEEGHANYIFFFIKEFLNIYSYQSVYDLTKELFKNFHEFPRLQLKLLTSMCEGLYFNVSKDFDAYFTFVFENMTKGSYADKVLGLRSLSMFVENCTVKLMEKFDQIMECMIITLDQLVTAEFDEKVVNIYDEIMIVSELLVENGDPDKVEKYGFVMLEKLNNFIQNKSLNLELRKQSIRVAGALIKTMTHKQIEQIYVPLMGVMAQTCMDEYLMSESLIVIGSLCQMHLQDYTDQAKKVEIYEKMYHTFVQKAYEMCKNAKQFTDYDLLEAAFSLCDFVVIAMKRDSVKYIHPNLSLLTIEYIESKAFVDDGKCPLPGVESEDELDEMNEEEEEDENMNAYNMNISFKMMLIAAFKFVGNSMEILPDLVLKDSMDSTVAIDRMKSLFKELGLDENQDVRCQSFKAITQMSLGLLERCSTNISTEVMEIFHDFSMNEIDNLIINKFFGILNDWIKGVKSLVSQLKIVPEIFYNTTFLNQVAECVKMILKKHQNFLDPDVIGQMANMNESICRPLAVPDYKAKIEAKYGKIKMFPVLASKYVQMPQEYFNLVLDYIRQIYKDLFHNLVEIPEDLEVMCIEELSGSLAELINLLGIPLIQMAQELYPEVSIVDIVFNLTAKEDESIDRNIAFFMGVLYKEMNVNIFGDRLGASVNVLSSFYQKYPDNPEVKDNCLSSMCKLFLNKNVSAEVQSLILPENLYAQIETSLPFEGDPEEANSIWTVLLQLALVDKESVEKKILNTSGMIFFVLKTLVTDNVYLDDQVFEWLFSLAKSEAAREPIRKLDVAMDASMKFKLEQVFI